jgi:hypothetical protein
MDIATYVSTFPEKTRDVVVEQVMKGKLLKQALNTISGKVILNSAIDEIHKNLNSIINLCISEKRETKERIGLQIEYYANEVLVTYRLMKTWAQIIEDSEKHEKAMKK